MKSLKTFLGCLLACSLVGTAFAQYTYTPPVYSPLRAITSDVKHQGVVSSLNRNVNNRLSVPGVALSAPATAAPRAADQSYAYQYKRERTRQNLNNFIKRSPEGGARDELAKIINAQPTMMDDLRAAIAPYGLDTHDVADAYTLWWINAWLVANKRDEDPSKGTIAMVKQQVRDAFAATPDFANTNDVQRQEYAEALLLQATMLSSAFEQWQGNADRLDQLARAARKGAKESGIDLSLMTLTRNGFMPREGAEATDTDASERDAGDIERRAAIEGDDNSTALALAAGAGLGFVLLGGAVMMRRQG
ncbi:MAG: DUF6683 family protein [Pseudomonadota bacterium]